MMGIFTKDITLIVERLVDLSDLRAFLFAWLHRCYSSRSFLYMQSNYL